MFYPCERIIENKALSIGNIEKGVNTDIVNKFLNIGKLTEENCKKCWAIRFCNICISGCVNVDTNEITQAQKEISCIQQKNMILSFLKRQINPKFSI